MQINSGCFDHCVLQRGGPVNVTGLVEIAAGKVVAVVTKKKQRIAHASAPIHEHRFKLRFANLPAGGPYEVTFTAGTEKLVVKDVLVGDVWICAGQSNMQGLGYLRHALPPKPMVRAFYTDDHWDIARDPIHTYGKCVDDVHRSLNPNPWPRPLEGVGPAVSYGQEMWRHTGVPQGLIACAHGGSSMDQWNPALKVEGGKSLYGATLRRIAKNGGRVAGLLWYQGESEAGLSSDALAYTTKTVALMKAFRRDLGAPRLPIVMAQIGRRLPPQIPAPLWNMVQDQQHHLPKVIPNLAVVPSLDLLLDDDIHIGGDSNTVLGKRFAEAMDWLRIGKGSRPQIVLRSVRVVPDPLNWWGGSNIIAEFGNVSGKLTSLGRPNGFTVGNPSEVYGVILEGSRAIIRVVMPPLELTTLSLHYGQGTNPYCNITAEDGHPMPAFGPVPLGAKRVLTAFVKPRISQVFPSAGKLVGLEYPPEGTLDLRTKPFPKDFCDIHDEFTPGDQLIYFASDFTAAESMKLVALFGYDGPVKLWVDGKELFHDPNGTNPGVIDAKCIRFETAPGKHRLLVALGSNSYQACGIYLRLQRLDVSKSKKLPKLI